MGNNIATTKCPCCGAKQHIVTKYYKNGNVMFAWKRDTLICDNGCELMIENSFENVYQAGHIVPYIEEQPKMLCKNFDSLDNPCNEIYTAKINYSWGGWMHFPKKVSGYSVSKNMLIAEAELKLKEGE